MRINYRIKRTTKQYIIVSLICIVIIGGASLSTTIFVTNQIKGEYKELLEEANYDLEMNQRNVFVSVVDIAAGDALTDINVKSLQVYSSQPQSSFITNEQFGQMALIDIPKDTQIISSMLTNNLITSELREVEYQVININTNIISNDTIDVRINFPNGENLIVLSKKVIKGVSEDSLVCYLWLDAEEILRMSAAIVDAALYPGTQLTTTKYIEPSIQKASEVTYTPSLAILELLEIDPNILERSSQELGKNIRKALENRLASSMSTDVSEINWEVNPYKNEETSTIHKDERDKVDKSTEELNNADIIKDKINTEDLGDSGSLDYFYYAEEKDAKDGVMEYGE
jgi:hypothetical protein